MHMVVVPRSLATMKSDLRRIQIQPCLQMRLDKDFANRRLGSEKFDHGLGAFLIETVGLLASL